jgi:hypothetical protein
MDFERQGDNHSDAEPARGCLSRAGLKPERGSVEKLPRKSKGAVSKRVIPLTGDRGFESLYLHREESSAHPVLPAVAVPRSGGPANEGSERQGFSRSGPFRRTLRRHILSSSTESAPKSHSSVIVPLPLSIMTFAGSSDSANRTASAIASSRPGKSARG